MTAAAYDPRALALRVAKTLRDKGRSAEAVLVLSAWAASGPNDAEGQALLAEALRLEPKSAIAKMAFERMEGMVASDHAELDKAIARYTAEELARLEREVRPAVFQRAQVGFNNNVKYKSKPYHVQTEDSGLGKPHIITHVFADGGRIIKSHKRSYADAVEREDVAAYVRALMKGQHMENGCRCSGTGASIRSSTGSAPAGWTCSSSRPWSTWPRWAAPSSARRATRPPAPLPRRARAAPSGREAKVHFTLHVLKSPVEGPDRYEPRGENAIIGSEGAVSLVGERFCHPREASLTWEGDRLWLEDLEGGNGVFMRIRSRVAIGIGTEFVVGEQLLRLERNPEANDGPDEGPTYFLSSLKGPSAFRVVQIFEGGAVGACAMARETLLQIGSALEYANDMVLGNDPLVARYHCVIEEQAEVFVLTDLGAKSGVFVRVTGRQGLSNGDQLLVGRTRLLVDLSVGS